MTRFVLLLLPPVAWALIWLVAFMLQVDVLGETEGDIVALELVRDRNIPDWAELSTTALQNRARTRYKLGISLVMFLAGIVAIVALFADVAVLHSVLSVVLSGLFFIGGILFLSLSFIDRGMYQFHASTRIKHISSPTI